MKEPDEPTSPATLVDQFRPLAKEFRSDKQLRKLVLAGLSRWLVTVAIILCLYGTLIEFSNQPVLSQDGKRLFNTLITALSIALGLNVVSSLKAMALGLRWWILSWRMWTMQEVDLILHAESLAHLVKLGFASNHIDIRVTVVFWLLFNAAAQIGVAMLGLAYSIDTADHVALLVDGFVAIPNMTTIQTAGVVVSNRRSLGALEYTANSFGTMALALGFSDIGDLPHPGDVVSLAQNNLLFSGDDYWTYVFYEIPGDPFLSPGLYTGSILSVATDRSVNSSAVCRSWPVLQGGDGMELNITVNAGAESTPSVIPIPVAGGIDQTTFMTRDDGTASCGPGCSRVTAFEASATAPWYYDCNVTIGKVANATRSEHDIGPVLKTLASSAIAIQGDAMSSFVKDPAAQYQIYPAESTYGLPLNGSNDRMAMNMAQFAIRVIALTSATNMVIVVPGRSPQAGLVLNVSEWQYVHIILSLTGGLHLVLAIAVAFIGNRVIVRDNSPLASAKLLEPIVGRLGQSGSTASGEEIAKELGKDLKVVYCVESSAKSGYSQVRLSGGKARQPFVKGWYD